jgi:hypothetical protein
MGYTDYMFLYGKRTRKLIKFFWGFFAILVILSMVITYSGFTRYSHTTQQTQNTQTQATTSAPASFNPAIISTSTPTQKLVF